MVVQIGIYQSNSGILRGFWKLKDVAKRLSAQYLKEDYPENILESHLGQVSPDIPKASFLPMDVTDIIIKYAKYMKGWNL